MAYTPKSGDIVWLDFDPQSGHEQKGRRPALIVWGTAALEHMPGIAQVCAISTKDNGFPLHLELNHHTSKTKGYVLCEQNKVLDLNARNVKYKDHVSDQLLLQVKNTLKALLD